MQHTKKEISDQNLLIWLFWAVSLKKYCHIWNQHLWICQHAKFRAKLKILSFGTKNAWFKWMPDFSANLKENYCHILNQQPLISRKGVFVQLVNFGIGSTFSKGLLYKVCRLMVNTRGAFRTQSNIYDGDFYSKIVNSFWPLTIFPKKIPSQMFNWVLNRPLNTITNIFSVSKL